MRRSESLYLYKEILLLALRDEQGTPHTDFASYLVAGAALAELIMEGRIEERSSGLSVRNAKPLGDPILDSCLKRLTENGKKAGMKTWLPKLAGTRKLLQSACGELVKDGILRSDSKSVLLFFSRDIYPEVDPEPERRIIRRIRSTLAGERELEPRTAVLIALARSAKLLKQVLSPAEMERYEKRMDEIAEDDSIGSAARAAIEACQTAIMVAVITPTVIT